MDVHLITPLSFYILVKPLNTNFVHTKTRMYKIYRIDNNNYTLCYTGSMEYSTAKFGGAIWLIIWYLLTCVRHRIRYTV